MAMKKQCRLSESYLFYDSFDLNEYSAYLNFVDDVIRSESFDLEILGTRKIKM